jgi:hypothetical protein
MSISVLQTPSSPQGAQSPVIFSVIESNGAYTGSAFQYTAKLYAWSGTTVPTDYIFQVNKYPNASNVGMFDFSKLLSSKLRDLCLDNPSSVLQYKVDFSTQWYTASVDGNILQTGTTTTVSTTGGDNLYVYDGYQTFPNGINSAPGGGFPIMSDATNFTQSVNIDDVGFGSVWVDGSVTLTYAGIYEDGSTSTTTLSRTSTAGTEGIIKQFPTAPGNPGFPISDLGLKSYSISHNGKQLVYVTGCESYYTPIRVCFKNRYGQLDWISFNKRHNRSFSTEQRVYQPQLGSWNATTLDYNTHQARNQRYIVDSTERLSVQSDWIDEGYNEMFKELLVSDEIYYVSNGVYYPLSIDTSNIEFKTKQNDKLIQYGIVFEIGASYKQII